MDYQKKINFLLGDATLSAVPEAEWIPLSGDGSDRKFFRIGLISGGSCLVVFPSTTMSEPEALAESYSAYVIGNHLEDRGVSVPHVFAYDKGSGGILFEDLGDRLLYDIVQKETDVPLELYRKALENLVVFQVKGMLGFKASYCWDTSHYSRQLMLSRESGYFVREFCTDYLGITDFTEQLYRDFEHLANRVGQADCRYLLHRDYQSRNLMVSDKGLMTIIDFQGARFGPLGYDVASLLNDPYINMQAELKTDLLGFYLDTLSRHISFDRKSFIREYYYIALQRNLQVLGAFSFLSQKKKKLFFKDFIAPAFDNLFTLVNEQLPGKYIGLERLITECENKMDMIAGNY